MSDRPVVTPAVVASVTEDAPARVRRKLDRSPDAASEWKWQQSGDEWTIDSGGETVRLTARNGIVGSVEDVGCSCLLSPRCYHLLACLSVLPIGEPDESDLPEASASSASENEADERGPRTPAESVAPDPAQIEAAELLWPELAGLLAIGARSAGSLTQAHLMRALHECRSVGLHRLAAVGLRVLQQVRQLRQEDDTFDSAVLVDDLSDAVELAFRLKSAGKARTEWIGTARRAYFPIDSLSLQALFTEPILTASGHAGVVTYLMDQAGVIFSVSNVRPGEPSRVNEAWQTGIDLGGLSVSHRELSRSGLLLQRGTASTDGRLGAGQNSRAVTKKGDGWTAPGIEHAFASSIDDQIARVFAASRNSLATRRAGWDLVFLRGVVVGTDGRNLIFQTHEGRDIRMAVSQHHDTLAFHDNLTLLTHCPGLPLRIMGRLNPGSVGRVEPLAAAADTYAIQSADDAEASWSGPQLRLPDELSDHVSLGLEKLTRGHLTTAEREPVSVPVPPAGRVDDGLSALRRRIGGLALGGRHSLPTRRISPLARESAQLSQSQPTAAALLRNLGSVAVESESNLSGLRFPADPLPLARIWLACSRYESSCSAAFQEALWHGE